MSCTILGNVYRATRCRACTPRRPAMPTVANTAGEGSERASLSGPGVHALRKADCEEGASSLVLFGPTVRRSRSNMSEKKQEAPAKGGKAPAAKEKQEKRKRVASEIDDLFAALPKVCAVELCRVRHAFKCRILVQPPALA